MTDVFVVDDHEVVRDGVVQAIGSQPDLRVVGEASTARQAWALLPAIRPDVVILDVHLPDGNGIDLCRRIRQQYPSVRCLILTGYDDEDAMLAAVMADAAGYLLKSARTAELITAVRDVADGRTLLHPSFAHRTEQRMRSASDEDPRFTSLSLRERQILALIADGLTNRQIGDRLALAEKTVKNYVSTLLGKLGFDHRTQAAIFEVARTNGRP